MMIKIGPEESKAAGSAPVKVNWPTMDQVKAAVDRGDGVTLLRWFRNLPSPPMDDEGKWEVLDEINRIVVTAMRNS